MTKEQKEHGRFIELHWPCDPVAYYVRGHVAPEQMREALSPWLGTEVAADVDVMKARHGWARWIPTPHGDSDRVLREEPMRNRGCFAVTVIDAEDLDHA